MDAVIDVHTHMLNNAWLKLLEKHGRPRYTLKAVTGVKDMEMQQFQLVASIGFTTDTTLAVARMIYDGFFDRFQKLKIIASHGGGTLPYLIGRMDQCYDHIPACRTKTGEKPSLH